jgi:hypothetical protein
MAVFTLMIAALFHLIEDRKPGWFFLGAAVLVLSMTTMENSYIFGFIGLVFIVELVLWERLSPRKQVWLYLGGAVLALGLLAVAMLLARAPAAEPAAEGTAQTSAAAMKLVVSVITVLGGTIPAVLLSASLLRSRYPRPSSVEEAIRALSWQHWVLAAVVMFLIYTLLFTTFSIGRQQPASPADQ